MGYTYNFFDNQLIGVDELNKITKTFIRPGVAQESPEITSVSDLNKYIANAIISGGLLSGSNVQLQVSNIGNQTLKIAPGEAILPDGRIFTVDSEGTTITYSSGKTNYVYVVSDLSKNQVYPIAYTSKLTEGNHILLAEITEDGSVSDKRTFAVGKATNNYFTLTSSERIIIENQSVTQEDNVRSYTIPDNIKSVILDAEDPYSEHIYNYRYWFSLHYDLENNCIVNDLGTYGNSLEAGVWYRANAFKGVYSYGKKIYYDYGLNQTRSVEFTKQDGILTVKFDILGYNFIPAPSACGWKYKLTFLT